MSQSFKTLFTDIFDDNQNRNNVKFVIEDIPDENGQFVNAETEKIDDNNFIIRLNSQIFTQSGTHPATNIEIAKTILHECIHAHLYVVAQNTGATINNMNVSQALNAIYTVGNAQHNFMIQNMLPTMENILNQLLDVLNTPVSISSCEIFPIGTNNQWNWSEYFHFLSLQGLEETNDFVSQLQPVFNSSGVMTGGNALGDMFVDYTTIGHDNLDSTLP